MCGCLHSHCFKNCYVQRLLVEFQIIPPKMPTYHPIWLAPLVKNLSLCTDALELKFLVLSAVNCSVVVFI